MKKKLPDQTFIVHGKTSEFQVFPPIRGGEPILREDIVDFEIQCETKSGFFYEAKLFKVELAVEIGVLLVRKRKPRKCGVIKTEFVFQVESWDDWVVEKEEQLYLDPGFVITLTGVAYSSTRGILMARAAGTLLEGCMLPLIDPGDLVSDKED